MSKKNQYTEEEPFGEAWIDVDTFTSKEWEQIREIALEMKKANKFKGDGFKCTVSAFVLWINTGNGLSSDEPAPEGTLVN